MKAGVGAPTRAHIPERTFRTDRWWAYPLSTGAILLFGIKRVCVHLLW